MTNNNNNSERLNTSVWSIDEILIGIILPDQSGAEGNGKQGTLHFT